MGKHVAQRLEDIPEEERGNLVTIAEAASMVGCSDKHLPRFAAAALAVHAKGNGPGPRSWYWRDGVLAVAKMRGNACMGCGAIGSKCCGAVECRQTLARLGMMDDEPEWTPPPKPRGEIARVGERARIMQAYRHYATKLQGTNLVTAVAMATGFRPVDVLGVLHSNGERL